MDGIDACIREVRKQIGAGADWIKVGRILPLYEIRLNNNNNNCILYLGLCR